VKRCDIVWVLLVGISMTLGTSAFGQSSAPGAVRIDITRVDQRIAIAVPDFAAAPGQEALGAELAEIVRYDLDFSCLFTLLSRDRYPKSFVGFTSDAGRIDFPAWGQTGIEFLVYAYVTMEQGRIVLEGRLFEVRSGQQYVGKRFTATADWKRHIAHQFSDEIVLALTGEAGIATSQICFSGFTSSTGNKEIYVVDYDGANLKRVTEHNSTSILPQFSPEGNRIAYLSFKDRFPFLYVLDLTTGKSTYLSKDVGMNVSPAWAPDGSQLAIALSKDANAEIYLVNPDGSGKRRVTNAKSLETSPSFSPDGKEIVFVSDRLGGAQIFASGLDGSNLRRLSYQGGRSYDPEWSPDGKKIVYVVESGGFEIYVMNADGSDPRKLTDSPGSNESPSWSKDSRHIVFASSRSGRWELWTVNVETGMQRRINIPGLECQGPSWGPRRGAN